MPSLLFVSNELRRRRGRTIVTALGLASGVGMVMAIVGVSQGLDAAQRDVLSPLRSVGTDILVTRTVAATKTTATPSPRRLRCSSRAGGREVVSSAVDRAAREVVAACSRSPSSLTPMPRLCSTRTAR